MKINLFWTAVIAELRFIKSSTKTKTVKKTEIVEATIIILIFKKWLFKTVMILNLINIALTAVII